MKRLASRLTIVGFVFCCFVLKSHAADVEAVRNYSKSFTPGQNVTVTIQVKIDPALTLSGIIVEEILPPGWTFVSASPGESRYDADSRTIEWLFFDSKVGDQTVQYVATAQSGDAFQGQVIYAGANDVIHYVPITTGQEIAKDIVVLDVEVPSNFQTTGEIQLTIVPFTVTTGMSAKMIQRVHPLGSNLQIDKITVTPSQYQASANVIGTPAQGQGKPLAVAMDFDSSGSMDSSDNERLRVEAGKSFVDQLGAQDTACVFDFGVDSTSGFNVSRLFQDFTSDHALLKQAIDRVQQNGVTTLYGSVFEVLSYFDQKISKTSYNRALFLFSDGKPGDNDYRQSSIDLAKQTGIPIITVGLGPAAGSDSAAVEALRTLALETNGIYAPVQSNTDLQTVFSQLSRGLTSDRLIVTLKFNPIPPPGTTVKVVIETNLGNAEFTFVVPGVSGQTGITGRIFEDGSVSEALLNGLFDRGEGLAGCSIAASKGSESYTGTSAFDGTFTISMPSQATGNWSLKITKPYYKEHTQTISISSTGIDIGTIDLQKEAIDIAGSCGIASCALLLPSMIPGLGNAAEAASTAAGWCQASAELANGDYVAGILHLILTVGDFIISILDTGAADLFPSAGSMISCIELYLDDVLAFIGHELEWRVDKMLGPAKDILPEKTTVIVSLSPVNLQITDSQGRSIFVDSNGVIQSDNQFRGWIFKLQENKQIAIIRDDSYPYSVEVEVEWARVAHHRLRFCLSSPFIPPYNWTLIL